VCCFVLLIWYWGIVTVPGCPRVNRPHIITWGGRILTLHLNYVAGYTGLFERTHNYYIDNQGLVPWRLRRLGRSKVRSASLVKVLSDGKISWILWSRGHRVLQARIKVFFLFETATQLARQVQQERTQVVCINKVGRSRLAQRHSRNGPSKLPFFLFFCLAFKGKLA